MSYRYTVKATFEDEQVATHWLRWLEQGHCRDVLDAGANRAQVVRLDGPAIAFEARYDFADRAAFERYEQQEAPRLRQEGLDLFPVERGVQYERSSGVLVYEET